MLSGVRKVSLTVVVPRLVAAVGTQESSGSVVCLLAVCLAVATHGGTAVALRSHRAQWSWQWLAVVAHTTLVTAVEPMSHRAQPRAIGQALLHPGGSQLWHIESSCSVLFLFGLAAGALVLVTAVAPMCDRAQRRLLLASAHVSSCHTVVAPTVVAVVAPVCHVAQWCLDRAHRCCTHADRSCYNHVSS